MNPLEPFENDLQEMQSTRPIGYQLYHNSQVYVRVLYEKYNRKLCENQCKQQPLDDG